MSELDRSLFRRASELREAFDRSFAEAEPLAAEAPLELLLIRVRGNGYALRLGQVLSLQADRKLVPLPSSRPELLGLVGLRGQAVPVYDLSLLLGHAAGASMRWLALVRAASPLAVAFEHFEGQLRAPRAAVVVAAGAAPTHRFASASVATPDGARPVIDLTALVAELAASTRETKREREEQR